MTMSADQWILWQGFGLELNATIVFTWLVMAILVIGSIAVTARLSDDDHPSRWQSLLEVLVVAKRSDVSDFLTLRWHWHFFADARGSLRFSHFKAGRLTVLGWSDGFENRRGLIYARIAWMSGATPRMLITRVRL